MTQIIQAETAMIRPSPTNPRKNFDKAKLEELGRSILEKGMIQPLVVRFIEGTTKPKRAALECVVGERRLKAAKLAGLKEVPVIIQELTDVAVLELQTIENLQREDLTEIEEADGYAQLMELAAYEVDGIAQAIGKSTSYVYQRLKLLELCKKARKALLDGEISAGHAILIARHVEADQEDALKFVSAEVYEGGVRSHRTASVRDLRTWIASELVLNLSQAPFSKKAEDLVPAAGPCTTCPYRTGNSQDLFPEITKSDRCTNRGCYASKIDAHLVHRTKELTKLHGKGGFHLIATTWVPYLHKLPPGTWKDDWHVRIHDRKNKCANGKPALVVYGDTQDFGRVKKSVCVKGSCETCFPKAAAQRATGWQEDEKKRQRKMKKERTYRRAVFDALRAVLPRRAERIDLEWALVNWFVEMWHERRKKVLDVLGLEVKGGSQQQDAKLRAWVESCTDTELHRTLIMMAAIKDLNYSEWSDQADRAETLHEMAERYGVKVKPIRKTVDAEFRKKPTKKKGATKKKAAE